MVMVMVAASATMYVCDCDCAYADVHIMYVAVVIVVAVYVSAKRHFVVFIYHRISYSVFKCVFTLLLPFRSVCSPLIQPLRELLYYASWLPLDIYA